MTARYMASILVCVMALSACESDEGMADLGRDASTRPSSTETDPASDFAACEVDDDCVLRPVGCCFSCEVVAIEDVTAVNRDRIEARRAALGCSDEECRRCAPVIPEALSAVCRSKRCDVQESSP